MKTCIMHVDMDAFFASVEERANPTLRGLPLAVAGPGERSIITTASYAARAFGVRTGMTIGQAKTLCRSITVVRADYRKYASTSIKVMEALKAFTPDLHIASVDEACLDVSALVSGSGDPAALGRKVKDAVRGATGLTCSVGMAPGRLLAKLASAMDKPDGLTCLSPAEVPGLLEITPVQRICGIGPVTTKALQDLGITTCGQLGRYPESCLVSRFGSQGKVLSRMGRGEDIHPFAGGKREPTPVKSIGHSVTLPQDLGDRDSMKRVLMTLSEMVGRRARRHKCAGGTLTLTWRTSDFSTRTSRRTLCPPLSGTREIYGHSLTLLDRIDLQKPVRLLGLTLSHLSFEEKPMSLFREERRALKLQEAVDAVNDRFGEFALAHGDSLRGLGTARIISPSWKPGGDR